MMIQSFFSSIAAVVIVGVCLSDTSYALIVNTTPPRYYNFSIRSPSTGLNNRKIKVSAVDRGDTRYQTILYTIPNDNDAEEEITSDESPIDFDQQKIALEGLLKNSSNTDTTMKNKSNILTSSRKMRLEREIELIQQLDPEHPDNNEGYSDSQNQELVVQQLWSLWYGERGRANEVELRKIEDTTVEQSQWPEAESRYLELIRKHCSVDGTMDNLELSNWVEPANRLATLLFLMGRLKESKQWCKRILNVKPWHIGALSGIAIVCMQMGDGEGVIKYSLMGLPNLNLRKQRKEWIENNVYIAEKQLLRLEELSRESYGEPDTGRNYAEEKPSDGGMVEDVIDSESDSDAW